MAIGWDIAYVTLKAISETENKVKPSDWLVDLTWPVFR